MNWGIRNDLLLGFYSIALLAAAAYLVVSYRLPATFPRRRGRLKAWGWACFSLATIPVVLLPGTAGVSLTLQALLVIVLIGAGVGFWLRAGRLAIGKGNDTDDRTGSLPGDATPTGKHAAGRRGRRAGRGE